MTTFNKEPEISVGILTEEKIEFELHGDFKVSGLYQTFSGQFSAEIANDTIICKGKSEKLQILDEIIFEPQDPALESFLLKDVTIGVKFHWERKEKQRFTGALKLKKDKNKSEGSFRIAAINILPIEKYLVSVISSEMSAKSSLQLLKAHAIVSRSWFLAQIEKSKSIKKGKTDYDSSFMSETEYIKWYDREDHTLFDVCADDHCQRYQGITKVFTNVAREAVEQTKGIVLMSEEKICDTRYHKACGGITESFENVWEPITYPYLRSVIDYKFEPDSYNLDFSIEKNAEKWIRSNPPAYCNTNEKRILAQVLLDYDQETTDFYRWKVEYSQKEISSIINKKSGIDFGEILDLIPIERGASSRLIKLKIVGKKKSLIIGKELEIRRTLSPSHLYSSAFVVEKKDIQNEIPQKFILIGAGWGHGVGLCQLGAAVMAARGHLFDEILLHYFRGAELKNIYQLR
jgi:SpoIID/LytB domain protein